MGKEKYIHHLAINGKYIVQNERYVLDNNGDRVSKVDNLFLSKEEAQDACDRRNGECANLKHGL